MSTALTDYSLRVAGAVKAELARRDLEGYRLAQPLKLGRNAVYARLRGEQAFEVNELSKIADFLRIDVAVLVDPPPITQALLQEAS